MSTFITNLTDNQRLMLRHLVDLNLKSASAIAVEAGMNRGNLVSGLAGNRAIPADKLHTLLSKLGLNDRWEPLPTVAHYLRVGADVEPLIRVIDVIFESAKMYAIRTPGQHINAIEAYTGFFLFAYNTVDGHGFALVHRDRFRAGKGVVVDIDTDRAKAIEPELFENVAWAEDPVIELDQALIKQLELPFYERADGPTLNRLCEILNLSAAVTWSEVIEVAKQYKLTAEDVLALIKRIENR